MESTSVASVQPLARVVERDRMLSIAWLGSYIAISAGVLSVRGYASLGALYAMLLPILAWTVVSRRASARMLGDIAPLVVTAFLYFEIPFLIAALGSHYHDAMVQGWEQALVGAQPAQTFARAMPNVVLSEILHAGYLSFYPTIFIPPLLLYIRGERRGYLNTVLALTATWIVCYAAFALFPVQGPRYLWQSTVAAPDGPIRRIVLGVLAAGSSRGAAFPSVHMAITVAQTLMAWRWQPRIAPWLAVISLLIGLGAVYGGFHYAVDIIAGAGVGAVVGVLVGGPRKV